MEKKNLLHTEQVNAQNKTIYLDLKVAENGHNFLMITQARSLENGETERVKMVLFEEELQQFSQALLKTLLHFQKNNKSEVGDDYKAKVRKDYPNAFQRWSKEDEELLKELYQQGHQVEELMVHFKRNERGIISRLEMMGIKVENPIAA